MEKHGDIIDGDKQTKRAKQDDVDESATSSTSPKRARHDDLDVSASTSTTSASPSSASSVYVPCSASIAAPDPFDLHMKERYLAVDQLCQSIVNNTRTLKALNLLADAFGNDYPTEDGEELTFHFATVAERVRGQKGRELSDQELEGIASSLVHTWRTMAVGSPDLGDLPADEDSNDNSDDDFQELFADELVTFRDEKQREPTAAEYEAMKVVVLEQLELHHCMFDDGSV